MALKLYRIGRLVYQFEEGTEPIGAEPVEEAKQAEVKNKAKRPSNKKAAASTKTKE